MSTSTDFPMNPSQWARHMRKRRGWFHQLERNGLAPTTILVGGVTRKRVLITEAAHQDWLKRMRELSEEWDRARGASHG